MNLNKRKRIIKRKKKLLHTLYPTWHIIFYFFICLILYFSFPFFALPLTLTHSPSPENQEQNRKIFCLALSANVKTIGSIPTLLVSMATTSYSGIGRYKLLPLSLSSSLRACPCPPSPSEAPIPARPGLRVCNLSLVQRPVLRLRPNGVSSHRRVINAVARAEPDRLGEESAKQVFQNFEIGIFLI
jgi:hypothetical protein